MGSKVAEALYTNVWLLSGLTGSVPGVLRLANGRFSLTVEGGRKVFDVPLPEVSNMKFPWYCFDGGVKFSVGADSYRVSFVQSN